MADEHVQELDLLVPHVIQRSVQIVQFGNFAISDLSVRNLSVSFA